MNRPEIVSKVNDIMHTGFEIPYSKLTPESNLFTDLGLDSLDAVDLLVHLEDNTGVKVDGDRLMKVRTLSDVYTLVEELQ
jgi:acyl carrier protein